MNLAIAEAVPGQPLGTAPLFLALSRADGHGGWSTLWLRTEFPSDPWGEARDTADGDSGTTWSGIPLSVQLDASLTLVGELALAFRISPVPPGLLALALVADSASGAAHLLLDNGDIDHDALLDLIQDELLGVQLEGLADFLPEVRGTTQPPTPADEAVDWYRRAAAGSSGAPDDVSLLAVLAGDARIDEKSNGELVTEAVTSLANEARRLGTRDARAVIDTARMEFDTALPNAQQLLFALADSPSPAVAGLLSVAGLSGPELAAAAIERDELSDMPAATSNPVAVFSTLGMFLMFAVIALVIRHVVQAHDWWELLFVIAVFYGPPAVPEWVVVLLALVLVFPDPLAGVVLVAEAGSGVLGERAGRTAFAAQTGVYLTLSAKRRFDRRRSVISGRRLRARDANSFPRRAARLRNAARATPTMLAQGTR